MTNDFDDLASAYIDGQLTEAEAARVEGDPELLAQVAELRSVSEALDSDIAPVDAGLKQQHLGAALTAFDELFTDAAPINDAEPVADPAPADGAVVSLDERRAASSSSSQAAQAERTTGRAGLPSWLGVAAGLLLVVGGIGFLSQVVGGSSDDTSAADSDETAAVEQESTDEEAGASEDTEELAESEEADRATGLADADAMDDSGEEAMEADEEAADESAPATSTTAGLPTTVAAAPDDTNDTEATAGGLFPGETVDEARVFYEERPDDEELQLLATDVLLEPELSICASDGVFEADPIVGFVPVEIAGVNGEVLFVQLEPDAVAVLVDEGCQLFP